MTTFIIPKINSNFKVVKTKKLCATISLALGLQMLPSVTRAAHFDPKETTIKQYLQDETPSDEVKTNENMDAVKDLIKLENTFNKDALSLTKQGLEKLQAGDKQQGLKALEESWNIDKRLIPTGIMLALNYIQSKNYDRAQEIAKEIQKITTKKEHGMGYTIEGIIHAAKGEPDKAKTAFKSAIRIMSAEKNALLNLAILEEQEKNYKDAKTYLKRIIDIEPTHLQALEKLARIEAAQGNIKNATDLLEKAINAHPDNIRPVIAQTQNFLRSGENQKALDLTENKTEPALLELRGKAYVNLGEIEKAKQIFENIVEQLPNSAPANYVLAEFFAATGNAAEAAKQVQNTLNKDSSFLPARIAEIKTLFYNGKSAEADQATQALIKNFGEKQEILSIAGWLASQRRDYVQAEQYFAKLAKINLDTELVLWWTNSLWAQKKFDQGFKLIKDWLKNNPDDISAQMALADGYMALQKKTEAKAAYLKIIDKQPKLAAAYNNLAWLVQEENLKQAINYAETAQSLEKSNPQVMDTLGLLLARNGQLDKGEALLKEATDKSPNSAELLYHYAEILMMQKKYTEAESILAKLDSNSLNDVTRERVKAMINSLKNK